MKGIFPLLLLVSTITLHAQNPVCYVYHGCGGATVAAYPGDPQWTNITYEFQRFFEGNWVTVHQTIENYHLVTPGDISLATQYRAIMRNNETLRQIISNSVIVDPARFNEAVARPEPKLTFYWGTIATNWSNYLRVQPTSLPNLDGMRPPFTFTIKKKDGSVVDQKLSSNLVIFDRNIEANQEYVVIVKDYCNQVDSVTGNIAFAARGRVVDVNCSGASVELYNAFVGENFNGRLPLTYGLAPLHDTILSTAVPQSIIDGISYNYSEGLITGLTEKRYVLSAKDRFGVISRYSVINTGIDYPTAALRGYGSYGGFCEYYVNLMGVYPEHGVRLAGTSDPYIFTPGLTANNLRLGKTYEIVVRDSCGRLSEPTIIFFPAVDPVITSVVVDTEDCKTKLTVHAQTCSDTPEYMLKISRGNPGVWQPSNIFVYESITGCDTVFVRDGDKVIFQEICTGTLEADVLLYPVSDICGSPYELYVGADKGFPPYTFEISSDGINFSDPTEYAVFNWLPPAIYTVRITDACGNTFVTSPEDGVAGGLFEVTESGFMGECGSSEGYLRINIDPGTDIPVNYPPYKYSVKEIISGSGYNISYGSVIASGETTDTDFFIYDLPGSKRYGIFITNDCDDPFTLKDRAFNDFAISGCNQFVTVWNLAIPGGANTEITFNVATRGTVAYTWETIPAAYSGSGTFSGPEATISNLPAGAIIRLNIQPENLERFFIDGGIDRNRLTLVENWGSTAWTSMALAFSGCANLQITAVDVPDLSGLTNMALMFQYCTALDSPENINTWNTASVTNMSYMFAGATSFNRDIGSWNTSSANDMSGMFRNANAFDRDIGNWNTAAVSSMSEMFAWAYSFNRNISSWNTSSVNDMRDMFVEASGFSRNIGSWTLNPGVMLEYMFDGSGMSCIDYSATLAGWSANPNTPLNRVLGAADMQYGTAAEAARTYLTETLGWTIEGDSFANESCEGLITGITDTNSGELKKITAWMERDEIVINGITEKAVALLYDLKGNAIWIRKIGETGTNRINVNGLITGIYVLLVNENGKDSSIKLFIPGN